MKTTDEVRGNGWERRGSTGLLQVQHWQCDYDNQGQTSPVDRDAVGQNFLNLAF
jgi:hypothetical protein